MSNIVTFNHLTSIQLTPLRALFVYSGQDDNELHLYHLEKSSTFSAKSKTRQHCEGGVVTLGWDIEADLHVPHNEYATNGLLEMLDTWAKYRFSTVEDCVNYRNQIKLYAGSASMAEEDDEPVQYNATSALTLDLGNKATLNYDIELADRGFKLVLKLRAFYKSLALMEDTILFT